MTDYYTVLGISEDSDTSEINAAYRKLALKWHPDRNASKEAIEKFNNVAEAFETLSNPTKRQKYDQRREKRTSVKGATVLRFTSDNANDVFEKIFGKDYIEHIIRHVSSQNGVACSSSTQASVLKPKLKPVQKPELRPKDPCRNPPPPEPIPAYRPVTGTKIKASAIPKNLRLTEDSETGRPISCPLEDLYTGKRRIVKLEGYTKMVIVEIPAGCHDGHQLPVKNPENGNITYFTIYAQKHPVYWRNKDNLHMNHELNLKEYVNGFTMVVTLLDGRKKKISHRYGGKIIGPDIVMKIPKLGMPKLETSEYGDLYIHFKVRLPYEL